MPSIVVPITAEGAVIEVAVGVSQPRAAALQAANQPIPQPISLRLLVDTGASNTSVQSGLLSPLGLTPTGSISLHTPSTGANPVACDQYDVSVVFGMTPFSLGFPTVSIIECQPLIGTIQGLLGRDILNHGVLSYNSLLQSVTISF